MGARSQVQPSAGATHLVCRVGEHRFALPVGEVEAVHRAVAVAPLPGAPANVIGAVDVHGTIVPVLDLRRRLGLGRAPVAPTDAFVQTCLHGQAILLLVDTAVDLVALDPEQLDRAEPLLPGVRHLRGITSTPEGPLVVHDLDAFLDTSEVAELQTALDRATMSAVPE